MSTPASHSKEPINLGQVVSAQGATNSNYVAELFLEFDHHTALVEFNTIGNFVDVTITNDINEVVYSGTLYINDGEVRQ